MTSVLILGGVGFIGRNLVCYLVENNLASKIWVVDKVLPETAYLSKRCQAAFEKVEFMQGNLVNPASIEKAFGLDGNEPWDVVFNLAAETKYGQTEAVYEEKVYVLSVNCAKEAAKRKVKVFVEASTGQVYDGDKKTSTEESKTKPWTLLAKYKLKAEEEMKKIQGLNLTIFRMATVYGPGDTVGITPRLIIGHVYKKLNEEMKFLWTQDLRINTVHVDDVVRALWLGSKWYREAQRAGNVEIFNLADTGETDQEMVNTCIREIFGIKTGFQGTIISNLARLNLESATEEVNDTHLQPWADLLKAAGITTSPLTPYLDQELLYNNSLSLSGARAEKVITGFSYSVPKITTDHCREVIKGFQELGIWPPL